MTEKCICQYCGKSFIPNKFNWRKKYCNKRCGDKHYVKLHPEVRKKAWRKYNEAHRKEQRRRSRKYYYENKKKQLDYRRKRRLENSARTRAKLVAKKHFEKICYFCNSKKNVEVHHKDFNPFNNKPKNLIYLCSICHGREHQKRNDNSNYQTP